MPDTDFTANWWSDSLLEPRGSAAAQRYVSNSVDMWSTQAPVHPYIGCQLFFFVSKGYELGGQLIPDKYNNPKVRPIKVAWFRNEIFCLGLAIFSVLGQFENSVYFSQSQRLWINKVLVYMHLCTHYIMPDGTEQPVCVHPCVCTRANHMQICRFTCSALFSFFHSLALVT